MATASGRSGTEREMNADVAQGDLLKRLYPFVDEEKTPLPRAWSSKQKFDLIGLSQNYLRVHYKGHGKTHRDAASVQATHPIPNSCGLYYFEVKIVSKGRDGYMGIGLSAQGVNMNRLPGWDKYSYGYHGDDGHSFCSSGTGQPYGPTFTTGDVIGCGVNLIDGTCFYTKNGHHLGTAFSDLPPNLYPTVGLQTPGEVIDANFGQEPFVFDIEDVMDELRSRTRMSIYDFPVPESQGEWTAILNKMVSSYLIHHGYINTAEAFAQCTNQPNNEDTASVKNRQRIIKLVLAGRMGEAIDRTRRLYPGLLEGNRNLLFMLKCRQFVEMVNGSDIEVCPQQSSKGSSIYSSPRPSSPIQTSVIQSTKGYNTTTSNNSNSSCKKSAAATVEELNQNNVAAVSQNGDSGSTDPVIPDGDVEMAEEDASSQNGHGIPVVESMNSSKSSSTNGYQNGNGHNAHDATCDSNWNEDDDMDMEDGPLSKKCCKPDVERILEFGRELYSMSQCLGVDQTTSEKNQKMLEDAFSLLAYSNPWDSPVGWQLNPVQRESVCASLNSAILELNNKPRKPPLEVAMGHAQELVRLMSSSELASCAFVSLKDLLEH